MSSWDRMVNSMKRAKAGKRPEDEEEIALVEEAPIEAPESSPAPQASSEEDEEAPFSFKRIRAMLGGRKSKGGM